MRQKISILLLLTLSLFFSSCATRSSILVERREAIGQPVIKPPKMREIIVIDAGHGGKDTGTLSEKNNYEEKKLNLETALVVKGFLEALGYPVIMTREKDVTMTLQDRCDLANTTSASLFVSVHYNFCPSIDVQGIEVYYYKDEKRDKSKRIIESKQLAEEIHSSIITHTGSPTRGVKQANLAVVRETKMPAILVEGGYLSNPKERERVKSEEYRRYLAWGIAKGIDRYLTKRK